LNSNDYVVILINTRIKIYLGESFVFTKDWLIVKKYFKYIKYAIPLLIIIITFITQHGLGLFLFEFCELLIVVFISDFIIAKNKIFGNVVNDILVFLLNSQLLVHMFTMEYITMVMLSNITLIEDLSGKAYVYIPAVLLVVASSVLPIDCFKFFDKYRFVILSAVLAAELAFSFIAGNVFSPMYNLIKLGDQYVEKQLMISRMAAAGNMTDTFYRPGLQSYRDKPENLVSSPNVIMIFVEGLSQSVVEDSRGIMPNVAYWESQSLHFTGYFNHTFATYRGLMGQLYSGYVYEDRDTNTLVSLPSAFSNLGYTTTFINTEPNNVQFLTYLETLGFDNVISDATTTNGMADSISDKDSFDMLFDTIESQADSSRPFYTAIYTFGTHASLDSPDMQFGDGSSAMLNKFYNVDYWFGEFMERFNESSLAENTIIVFTADHCTYGDLDFMQAFPDHPRISSEVDAIPLFIYYEGIEPEAIEVSGRNSLSLAPTLLDYLDISTPNYFLGYSLFMGSQNNNNYDTIFADGSNSNMLTTQGGTVASLTENQYYITVENLENYYTAVSQDPIAIYSN